MAVHILNIQEFHYINYKYIVGFKVPVRDCYEKGLEILLLRVHLKVLKLQR